MATKNAIDPEKKYTLSKEFLLNGNPIMLGTVKTGEEWMKTQGLVNDVNWYTNLKEVEQPKVAEKAKPKLDKDGNEIPEPAAAVKAPLSEERIAADKKAAEDAEVTRLANLKEAGKTAEYELNRDSGSGKFVSDETAEANPKTTTTERGEKSTAPKASAPKATEKASTEKTTTKAAPKAAPKTAAKKTTKGK